jgi:hypothetical protein
LLRESVAVLRFMRAIAGLAVGVQPIASTNRVLDNPYFEKLKDAVKNGQFYVWRNERSYFNDPLSVLSQTEELANWLAGTK